MTQLAQQIKDALAKGHFVHLSGYDVIPRDDQVEWTAKSLNEHFGLKGECVVTTLGQFSYLVFYSILTCFVRCATPH